MSEALYTNDNYEVHVNSDGNGYDVVNIQTGIVEYENQQLPDCIFAAESMNSVLVHRTYEWIAKQARRKAAEESGIRLAPGSGVN